MSSPLSPPPPHSHTTMHPLEAYKPSPQNISRHLKSPQYSSAGGAEHPLNSYFPISSRRETQVPVRRSLERRSFNSPTRGNVQLDTNSYFEHANLVARSVSETLESSLPIPSTPDAYARPPKPPRHAGVRGENKPPRYKYIVGTPSTTSQTPIPSPSRRKVLPLPPQNTTGYESRIPLSTLSQPRLPLRQPRPSHRVKCEPIPTCIPTPPTKRPEFTRPRKYVDSHERRRQRNMEYAKVEMRDLEQWIRNQAKREIEKNFERLECSPRGPRPAPWEIDDERMGRERKEENKRRREEAARLKTEENAKTSDRLTEWRTVTKVQRRDEDDVFVDSVGPSSQFVDRHTRERREEERMEGPPRRSTVEGRGESKTPLMEYSNTSLQGRRVDRENWWDSCCVLM